MQPAAGDWFATFFHGVAVDMWVACVPPESTEAEASMLAELLGCGPGASVLDVPCGNARHALALARRGWRMSGFDLSLPFLTLAREAAVAQRLPLDLWRGDMRALALPEQFDGAYCMGNSFAYMESAGSRSFLEGVARALKPGVRFVLQTGIAAESILADLKQRTWYEVGAILFLVENRYDARRSALETTYRFVRDGKLEVRHGRQFVYTVAGLSELLESAGLEVLDAYGPEPPAAFRLGDPTLHLLARKRP